MNKSALKLKPHAIGMVILLAVEYVLGMLTNLYVQFPAGGSIGQNWEFMHSQWLIWAHLIIGTLIILGMIALYVQAVKLKNRIWKIAGGIASASSVLAWICGEEFVSRQAAGYSLAMSLFFIIALLALGAGLYQTSRRDSGGRRDAARDNASRSPGRGGPGN